MTNLVELTIPKPEDPSEAARGFLVQATALKVVTADQYEAATDTLKTVKSRWAAIEAERVKIKKPIDDAAKAVQNLFRVPLETLASAEQVIKGKLALYLKAQEQAAREAQAKLDEAARKQREALEVRAAKAEESGKVEKAEALQQQAAAVVAPIVTVAAPKVTGLATKKVWKYRIVNPTLVPDEYWVIDESKLSKVTQALKADTNIPGIEVYEENQLSVRA